MVGEVQWLCTDRTRRSYEFTPVRDGTSLQHLAELFFPRDDVTQRAAGVRTRDIRQFHTDPAASRHDTCQSSCDAGVCRIHQLTNEHTCTVVAPSLHQLKQNHYSLSSCSRIVTYTSMDSGYCYRCADEVC